MKEEIVVYLEMFGDDIKEVDPTFPCNVVRTLNNLLAYSYITLEALDELQFSARRLLRLR